MNSIAFGNSTKSVQHSKDKALNDIEFELLYEGASQIDDKLMRIQTKFALVMLGRLGLRAGELAHINEPWVNWRKETIEIPKHEPCDSGRDGTVCGRCTQLAEQRADHSDEVSFEQALESYWKPKTLSASRGIYFGWNPRARLLLEQFFDKYDGWPKSVQVIARRIDRAAENTSEISADEVNPHPLRATAASNLAGKGLSTSAMKQYFGWADFSVAAAYIETSSDATAKQLSSLTQVSGSM